MEHDSSRRFSTSVRRCQNISMPCMIQTRVSLFSHLFASSTDKFPSMRTRGSSRFGESGAKWNTRYRTDPCTTFKIVSPAKTVHFAPLFQYTCMHIPDIAYIHIQIYVKEEHRGDRSGSEWWSCRKTWIVTTVRVRERVFVVFRDREKWML